ncbi:MAG TPA: DUF1731 domain-containing protein, partial [Spirochaetota bacterium]|nr:DUF1731 domain-containing protein [Spirochaetota bacterium]
HIFHNPSLQGPVNLCSPIPVTNYTLTKTLAKIMHRPSILPAPEVAIKIALGEFANNILRGQRVIPKKIMDDGFKFSHPELEMALREILQK